MYASMVQQHPLHRSYFRTCTYTMVDKNKVRGIPGVFGGAVSIGRNILCPQTYKKRWLILNTDTGKVSWCSFADPEREITSVTVCGDTLVFSIAEQDAS